MDVPGENVPALVTSYIALSFNLRGISSVLLEICGGRHVMEHVGSVDAHLER